MSIDTSNAAINTEEKDALTAFDTLLAEQTEQGEADALASFDTLLAAADREQGEDVLSTQMYEGMTKEAAQEKFDTISKSPNVTSSENTDSLLFTDPVTGRKEIILAPAGAYFDAAGLAIGDVWDGEFKKAGKRFTEPNATISTADKVMAGMVESWGAVLKTGAAVGEKMGFDGLLEAANENSSYIDTAGDISDSLLTDAVPAMVAGAPAAKVNALLQGSTLLIRGLATALTAEIGATATMNVEDGTAFIGENASVLPIAAGIKLGGSDQSEADKILSHRLNTLAEGLAIAGIFQPVGMAVEGTVSLVTKFALIPIANGMMGRKKSIERRVYAELMQSIAQLDGNLGLTPAQEAQARQGFLQILRDNKDIFIAGLNTINDKEEIVLDTVSAILRGLDPENEEHIPTIAVLTGLRQQHLTNRQGSGQTVAALEGPQRALHGELSGTAEQVGGVTPKAQTATIKGAAEEFADDGRRVIGDAADSVVQAQTAYDDAVNQLTVDIGTNLDFAGDVSRVANAVGTDIDAPKTGMRAEIEAFLKNSYENMSKKKNDRYAAISGGGINPQTIRDIFSEVTSESITAASDAVNASKPLRKLMGIVKPKEIVEEVDGNQVSRIETDDETLARIQQTLADEGIDFGFFYREIRPELAQAASDLYLTNPRATRMLRDVIKGIDGVMVDDVSTTSPALADAAKEAKRYYKEDYAPIWRSKGKLQEYADIHDTTLGQGGNYKQGFAEKSEAFANDILTGYNASSVDGLSRAIQAGGDDESASAIADYVLLDIFTNLARDVADGGVESINLGQVSELVAQYAAVLNKTFPEKAKQVNDFLELIQSSSKDKDAMARVLAANADNVAKAKQAVSESELSKFLSSVNPDDLNTTASPYAVFNSIFQDNIEGLATTQALVARMDNMEPLRKKIVMDGMVVAYMRFLNKRIFSVSQESGGTPALRKADVRATEDEVNSYLDMGKVIFKDTPEWMEGFTKLLSVAGQIAKQKQSTPVAGLSPTAFLQEAKTASGRVINMTLGPLNSMGTKMRAIFGGLFEYGGSPAIAQRIIDRIYADPNYILSLAARFDRAPMDPELKQQLIRSLIGTGTKELAAMEGGDVKQQMSDIFATPSQ